MHTLYGSKLVNQNVVLSTRQNVLVMLIISWLLIAKEMQVKLHLPTICMKRYGFLLEILAL